MTTIKAISQPLPPDRAATRLLITGSDALGGIGLSGSFRNGSRGSGLLGGFAIAVSSVMIASVSMHQRAKSDSVSQYEE
jgi:hypothetical protein